MPELPDVELYLWALRPRIGGQRLDAVRVAHPFLVRSVEPPMAAAAGRTVTDLRRLGKRIVLGLDADLFLVLHLMIAGRLQQEAALYVVAIVPPYVRVQQPEQHFDRQSSRSSFLL
jgi:formamidopyrimidine-DNA glycosylase